MDKVCRGEPAPYASVVGVGDLELMSCTPDYAESKTCRFYFKAKRDIPDLHDGGREKEVVGVVAAQPIGEKQKGQWMPRADIAAT